MAGELSLVGMSRLNVMLVGRADMVGLVLQTHNSSLQKLVVSWSPGEPFVLPVVERTGTLILHEVGALSLHDQLQLLQWLFSAMRRTHGDQHHVVAAPATRLLLAASSTRSTTG